MVHAACPEVEELEFGVPSYWRACAPSFTVADPEFVEERKWMGAHRTKTPRLPPIVELAFGRNRPSSRL
jgi:hypothetical protein